MPKKHSLDRIRKPPQLFKNKQEQFFYLDLIKNEFNFFSNTEQKINYDTDCGQKLMTKY